MKRLSYTAICTILVLSLFVPAFADSTLNEWIAKYNENASEMGAQSVVEVTEALTDGIDYMLVLSTDVNLSLSFNNQGDASLFIVTSTSSDADMASVTTAAFAASNDDISQEKAIDIIAELDIETTKLKPNVHIIDEKEGWLFYLIDASVDGDYLFEIYAYRIGDAINSDDDTPIDFWDGLWGDDDEATPSEAKPEILPPDKKIHKI